MSPTRLLIQGVVLGITLSPTCLGYCVPLLVPYFSSEMWRTGAAVRAGAWFLAGRLLGYALIGLVAGWAGRQSAAVGFFGNPWLVGWTEIGVGVLLGLSGLVRCLPELSFCKFWVRASGQGRTPGLLGLLTGLNICPPFVAAVYAAAEAGGAMEGLLVFLAFFAGTSLILLPLPLVNRFARLESIRTAARIASVLVGIWFLVQGVLKLLRA